MRALLLVISLCVIGCGGQKADTAVDDYINKDFAQAHAKLVAARDAYYRIAAADIDQPGKLEYLRFQLRGVAESFLAEALDEAKRLTPPAGAKDFHEHTLSTLRVEHAAIAELADALDPPNPGRFKAAHGKMMDAQTSVFTWEEVRQRMLSRAGVKLAPLPKPRLPEGATLSP